MSSQQLQIPIFNKGFADIFKSQKYADVEVEVNGKLYKAHRLLLAARSSFFKKEFADVSKKKITVNYAVDFDPILQFLYDSKTAEQNITIDNCVNMFVAAEFFGIASLRDSVNTIVQSRLSKPQDLYKLLDQTITCDKNVDVSELLKAISKYIAANVDTLLDTLKKKIVEFPDTVFFAIAEAIGEQHALLSSVVEARQKAIDALTIEFTKHHETLLSSDKSFLQKTLGVLSKAKLLNIEMALKYLPICEEFELKEISSGCAQVLAQNFSSIVDNKKLIKGLKPETLVSLLSSDELFVKSEDIVLDVALKYIGKHEKTLADEQRKNIIDCIRFPFISPQRLKKLKEAPPKHVPQEEIVEALWLRLSKMEGNNDSMNSGAAPAASGLKAKKYEPRKNRVFVYDKDFDQNGILYWLGTLMGADKYQNPHLRGYVTVSASSNNEVGKVYETISHVATKCNLVNKTGTYVQIKFHQIEVSPTFYSLRHTTSRDNEALRNWKLQASKDNVNYVDLKTHTNDAALAVKGATKTWQLDPCTEYYQYFRILMTGTNSSNNNYFSMAGFELYGVLRDLPADLKCEIKPNPV